MALLFLLLFILLSYLSYLRYFPANKCVFCSIMPVLEILGYLCDGHLEIQGGFLPITLYSSVIVSALIEDVGYSICKVSKNIYNFTTSWPI